MDFSIGSYDRKQSFVERSKSIYKRLTNRAKILLAVVLLILLYLIWPFSGSSASSSSTGSGNLTDDSDSTEYRNYQSISAQLNYRQDYSKLDVSYLNLPPFLDSKAQFPNYFNGGNMLLTRKWDFVRLVKDDSQKNGYLSSKTPISESDLSAFEIEIEFKIHGAQEKLNLIGDGMAIWLTSENIKTGDVFGASSAWDGLGLFIDTYKNYNGKKNRNSFPYLSLQRNNGNSNFYNNAMDGVESQTGGCSIPNVYNNENPTKMKITYVRALNIFEVSADLQGNGDWKVYFRREGENVSDYLPRGRNLYLSVSAETGQLHHNVDIYSIKVTSFRTTDGKEIQYLPYNNAGAINNENAPETEQSSKSTRRRGSRKTLSRLRRQEKKLQQQDYEKYGSENGFIGWIFSFIVSFFKLLFKLLLVAVALYGCLIGYRIFRDKQKKKNSGGLLL